MTAIKMAMKKGGSDTIKSTILWCTNAPCTVTSASLSAGPGAGSAAEDGGWSELCTENQLTTSTQLSYPLKIGS